MADNPELETVISGSFKFKPEIDALHEEMRDYNILVLAPEKGWFYVPKMLDAPPTGFRPLPGEQYMTLKEVEDDFLGCIEKANFLYLMNVEGYLGISAAFEVGYALGADKPIYAHAPLEWTEDWEDLELFFLVQDYIKVLPIAEISQDFHDSYTDQA